MPYMTLCNGSTNITGIPKHSITEYKDTLKIHQRYIRGTLSLYKEYHGERRIYLEIINLLLVT